MLPQILKSHRLKSSSSSSPSFSPCLSAFSLPTCSQRPGSLSELALQTPRPLPLPRVGCSPKQSPQRGRWVLIQAPWFFWQYSSCSVDFWSCSRLSCSVCEADVSMHSAAAALEAARTLARVDWHSTPERDNSMILLVLKLRRCRRRRRRCFLRDAEVRGSARRRPTSLSIRADV